MDVAARASVSRQTVSRVLNDKGEVRDETRARVLAAIDELGYRPSSIARSMVDGRTQTLGCIAPNLTDYTFASIIESAQAEAYRQGYFVLTGSAPTEPEVQPIVEAMLNRQVDGFLVLNPRSDERYRCFLPLLENHIPIVYIKNSANGAPVSTVCCDDVEGGYRATRYLLGLGHTTIATIHGPTNEECTPDRLDGYRRALTEVGLTSNAALVASGDWSATSGYRATQHLLKLGHPFSAVFAQNDTMAVGAIRALRDAGRQVPDEVSVIGYDDIPLASFFGPPLTTLQQPMKEFGRRAAQLIIKAVQEPNRPPQQIRLHARLIERASCAAPPNQVRGRQSERGQKLTEL
jgi:DNA-binding LacI/PurR family transcriptional regulator